MKFVWFGHFTDENTSLSHIVLKRATVIKYNMCYIINNKQ